MSVNEQDLAAHGSAAARTNSGDEFYSWPLSCYDDYYQWHLMIAKIPPPPPQCAAAAARTNSGDAFYSWPLSCYDDYYQWHLMIAKIPAVIVG